MMETTKNNASTLADEIRQYMEQHAKSDFQFVTPVFIPLSVTQVGGSIPSNGGTTLTVSSKVVTANSQPASNPVPHIPPVQVQSGSSFAPGYSFASSPDAGVYRVTTESTRKSMWDHVKKFLRLST